MKISTSALVGALMLAAAACGTASVPVAGGGARDVGQTSPPTSPPASTDVTPVDAALPGERPDELAFKPVPTPVQPPAPKPTRGLPTAPPDRPTPPPPSRDIVPVAASVADLADRLDVSAAIIAVLDARAVTWRDGSVGCPEDGLAYTQAEVPGYLVVLEADGASYRYHAAIGSGPFLCTNPQSPMEGSA